MQNTITLPQAAHEFGLDDPAVERIRRALGHHDRIGYLPVRPNIIVYKRAVVVAAIHADRKLQQARTDRERLRPTKPCGRCGIPIPRQWMLDQCHACLRQAA